MMPLDGKMFTSPSNKIRYDLQILHTTPPHPTLKYRYTIAHAKVTSTLINEARILKYTAILRLKTKKKHIIYMYKPDILTVRVLNFVRYWLGRNNNRELALYIVKMQSKCKWKVHCISITDYNNKIQNKPKRRWMSDATVWKLFAQHHSASSSFIL